MREPAGDDPLFDGRSRLAGFHRKDADFATNPFNGRRFGKESPGSIRIDRVIAALYVDIRAKRLDQPICGWFGEDDNVIDAFKSGDEFGAFLFRQDRTTQTLAIGRRCVIVDPDDQHVSELSCRLQVAQMPDMQEIEMSVGQNDPMAGVGVTAPDLLKLVNLNNLSHTHSASRTGTSRSSSVAES